MTTNLINNYISQNNLQKSNNNSLQKIAKPKVGMKPLNPKGELIKSNLLDAPAVMVKDLAYDIKALKNGFSGQANDHQLGKINDIGMKLGGLALASYLFTKKATPLTKGMEFVGFASFFASMAIWPKIALQAPAKLIHGFNVQQQYTDSYGRKKSFFQDPQYLPWDLYSDKEIHKIGDKLKVPRDIQNRREAIQDKMQKIATQNNTMWMLSAGFATPIMSALICNLAEKAILPIQDKLNNDKLEKMLLNPEKYSQKYDFSKASEKFENIFELNKEKPLTSKTIEEISEAIAPGLNSFYRKNLVKDLERIYLKDQSKILEAMDEEFAENVINGYKTILKQNFAHCEEDLKLALKTVPTIEQLKEQIKSMPENVLKAADNLKARESRDHLFSLFRKNIFAACDDEDFRPLLSQLAVTNLDKTIKSTNPNKFTLKVKKEMKELSKIFTDFSKKAFVYDDYAVAKVGQAPETVLANQWNKIADKLLTTLDISKKEAAAARYDRTLVQELLKSKLESIATDDKKYQDAVNKIAKALKEIDEKVSKTSLTKYSDAIDKLYDNTAIQLKKLGLNATAHKLAGIIGDESDEKIKDLKQAGSIKRMEKVFVKDRVSGVKNAFYRLLNTMDLYRRVATGNFGTSNGCLSNNMKKEVREEIIEASKHFSIQGHMSDEATKYWFKRNPNPDNTDFSKIDIENGKVNPKYQGKIEGSVDIPQDADFYKNSMRLRYENDLDSKTIDALQANGIKDKFIEYRKEFFEKIGGSEYFTKVKHHVLEGKSDDYIKTIRMTNFEEKFLLSGIAPDELITNVISKSFNTNKWLKMFGGLGLGVLGVTVASQFFFGKTPKIAQAKKDNN